MTVLPVWVLQAVRHVLFTGYLYSLTGLRFAWAQSHAAWGRS